ncbi:MAG: hypothetical protein AAFU65_02445 [Pseudomonadota bacterium]
MKRITILLTVALAALFAGSASAATLPIAYDYAAEGWTHPSTVAGTGARFVRRYIGPGRTAVSVTMTGFRAKPLVPDCYQVIPGRCFGETTRYRELNDTSAYIRDQRYDRATGWLTFTIIVTQKGYQTFHKSTLYWQLGYVIYG